MIPIKKQTTYTRLRYNPVRRKVLLKFNGICHILKGDSLGWTIFFIIARQVTQPPIYGLGQRFSIFFLPPQTQWVLRGPISGPIKAKSREKLVEKKPVWLFSFFLFWSQKEFKHVCSCVCVFVCVPLVSVRVKEKRGKLSLYVVPSDYFHCTFDMSCDSGLLTISPPFSLSLSLSFHFRMTLTWMMSKLREKEGNKER